MLKVSKRESQSSSNISLKASTASRRRPYASQQESRRLRHRQACRRLHRHRLQLSQLSGTCLRNAENKDQPRHRRPRLRAETQQRADPRIQRHARNRLRDDRHRALTVHVDLRRRTGGVRGPRHAGRGTQRIVRQTAAKRYGAAADRHERGRHHPEHRGGFAGRRGGRARRRNSDHPHRPHKPTRRRSGLLHNDRQRVGRSDRRRGTHPHRLHEARVSGAFIRLRIRTGPPCWPPAATGRRKSPRK